MAAALEILAGYDPDGTGWVRGYADMIEVHVPSRLHSEAAQVLRSLGWTEHEDDVGGVVWRAP